MTANHHSERGRGDREDSIAELKRRAEQTSMGEMRAWESDTLSSEEKEQFWRRVVEYETAPATNHLQQLTDAGLEVPEPTAIDDEKLSAKLWEVIGALARMRVFICQTDHLSDRELYTVLWREVLRDEIPMMPDHPNAAWHVDLLGSGSDADTATYLKYFADRAWRQQWLTEFPDYAMPAHDDPPHDRDRHLPTPYEELPSD